jgi:hypothetical protein
VNDGPLLVEKRAVGFPPVQALERQNRALNARLAKQDARLSRLERAVAKLSH